MSLNLNKIMTPALDLVRRAIARGRALIGFAFRIRWLIGKILLGFAGSVITIYLVDLPHGPAHWSADLQAAWLSKRPETQNSQIAIVVIDERALAPFPYLSPIDRGF